MERCERLNHTPLTKWPTSGPHFGEEPDRPLGRIARTVNGFTPSTVLRTFPVS